jgi:teichoic acid transport system permease protein
MHTVIEAGAHSSLRSYLRDSWRRRDFALHLALSNIAAHNAPTRLGALWWVVNPLFMTGIYFVVFGLILGGARGNPHFLAYLTGGILLFRLASSGITDAVSSLLGNAKLITSIPFPRIVLPTAAILENTTGFVVAVVAVFSILIPAAGLPITWNLALLPVVVLLTALFALGTGLIVAPLAIRNRDIKALIPHLTRIWLYLSPILWEMHRLDGKPAWARQLIQVNPLYPFLNLQRSSTLGTAVALGDIALATAWATLALGLGLLMFHRSDHTLTRYL